MCFDLDNGVCLGFRQPSDETLATMTTKELEALGKKYAAVVAGGENFTVLLRIFGGKHGKIEREMVIFKNKDRNYPIQGVPDDV